MTRGILIAGADSSLSEAVAAEAGKRVEQYAAAFILNRLSDPVRDRPGPAEGRQARISLDWNPGSPISARTLVLAAENRLDHIDEAIVVCTPPSVRRPVEQLAPADIDIVVNDYIKGWFFLVKELAAAFKARNAGTLALVLSDAGFGNEKRDAPDLMGPSVSAAFRAFVQGLLAAAPNKPYQTLAFSSETGEDAEFAAYIFKIIEENNKRNLGRWHKYGRLGLFGR
jgi:NADP-dependent 3-hydroxy acid dehydrogenase YdfG